jgi:hypothetical protein
MQRKEDHCNGLRHKLRGSAAHVISESRRKMVLLVIMTNTGAVWADVIVDDANETQRLPVFDDNATDLELPGHRNRCKTLVFAVASATQVVKRIFDKATALVVELPATDLPYHQPSAFITSIPDAPFRPPWLLTQA